MNGGILSAFGVRSLSAGVRFARAHAIRGGASVVVEPHLGPCEDKQWVAGAHREADE